MSSEADVDLKSRGKTKKHTFPEEYSDYISLSSSSGKAVCWASASSCS